MGIIRHQLLCFVSVVRAVAVFFFIFSHFLLFSSRFIYSLLCVRTPQPSVFLVGLSKVFCGGRCVLCDY